MTARTASSSTHTIGQSCFLLPIPNVLTPIHLLPISTATSSGEATTGSNNGVDAVGGISITSEMYQRDVSPKFMVVRQFPRENPVSNSTPYLIPERARPSTKYFWKAMNRMTTGSVMSRLIAMIRP